jgi:hypothetical protein
VNQISCRAAGSKSVIGLPSKETEMKKALRLAAEWQKEGGDASSSALGLGEGCRRWKIEVYDGLERAKPFCRG